MEVKHPFVSGKGDGPDSTRVRPSNWNANHNVTLAGANKYIGRDKSGAGGAQELPVVPVTGSDDGTIWTAAKVQEYVAQQIGSIPAGTNPIPIGTIVGSIVGTMPGFLPLNGQTFGRVGSSSLYESALYENIYLYLWTLNGPDRVEGGKGASGPADWAAGKSMFLPQSAGCVLGASGVGLTGDWLTVIGADTVALTEANMPAHAHGFSDNAGGNASIVRGSNSGLGGVGGGNLLALVGNDAIVTTTVGSGTGHPNIQRTILCQVFWIKY